MSEHADRSGGPGLARKLNFLLLTFVISAVVVFAMVAAGGRADGVSAVAAAGAEPQGGEAKVVPAQRSDDRELVIPPAQRKGPDPSLYLPNIADIVDRANPAVVNIRATEIIRPGTRKRRPSNDPFEFFFPRPDGRSPHGGMDDDDDDQRQDSGGSGFVVSEDGFVMTNYHVIEDADKIIVQLTDDSHEYEAKVIGTDPQTDLALLKIDARSKLHTIPMGDSDHLRVGEWVIAIGNPLAYDHTVTVGVVSAKGRKLVGLSRDVSLDNYIQTDAAINRGNSGGPLLNLKGEAVGINSAISVAGQGISFAIPINMARDVMSQLRDKGKVSRGFLGVTIQDVQQEMKPEEREYWGLDGRRGAFIQSVTPNLPAERAGLKPGDAVVSVDGVQLTGSDDLIRTISGKAPGSQVALGIVRDGKDKKLVAELIDRPDQVARANRQEPESQPDRPGSDRRSGITVEDISPDARREYRIPSETAGVVVTHISQVSSAWEKGLREGDVIVQVNRRPVSTIEEYRAVVEPIKPGDLMTLYVVTPGVTAGRFITLRVGEE
ncbi:MAG TPA: Do family serine endopeptidase [Candidatus Polarisedimenticolia bacterium]|jgi:serine protease Do